MNIEEAASILSHSSKKSARPKRLSAWLAIIACGAGLLLTASAVSGAPAGGSNAAARSTGQPFKVLDKNGTLVGYTVTENMVAREIDGVWVTFFVHPAVGIYDAGALYLNYLTDNCTGTAYITHYSTFSEGTRVGSKLYYPKDQQQLTPKSVRVATADGENGSCYAASDIAGVYGVAATVDVNSFGFELPFKAQQ